MKDFSDPYLEFDSDYSIRCPKCGEIFRLELCDSPELAEDGEHETGCDHCGHEFTVSTCVSITFTSPPMIRETGEVPSC